MVIYDIGTEVMIRGTIRRASVSSGGVVYDVELPTGITYVDGPDRLIVESNCQNALSLNKEEE